MCNPASWYRQRDDQQPARQVAVGVSLLPGSTPSLACQVTECQVTDEPAAPTAGGPREGHRGKVRTRVIREVVVVEATGTLSEVVEDLDRAMVLALAEGPRGLVCDLSAVHEGAEPAAIEVLATAGRHVRDWPGIPVVVASHDPQVRSALAAHDLGARLGVTASLFSAVTAVLATPVMDVERLRLAPHPTAPRAARDFVTRTLLGWRLGRVIPSASQVISDLVSRSAISAGTDIELSVAWDRGALRLTVRDSGPGLPGQQPAPDLGERELALVADLSRAFGVTPTADSGKVVWAVLEAPRTLPTVGRMPSEHLTAAHLTAAQKLPVFSDARGLAGMPFCAGASLPLAGTQRSRRIRIVG